MAPYVANSNSGGIEVVCGPMFSGKTEELIRRVRRAQIARQKVQIFKPAIDDRYHETKVVSHSSQTVEATVVNDSVDILKKLFDTTRIVAIDEVQFFDENIIKIVRKLSRRGIRVICAGLDQDFQGNSFGPMPELLAISDHVHKIQAICTVCGSPASKTHRRAEVESDEQVLVGETDLYEARCRGHWDAGVEEEELLAFSVSINNNEIQSETTL
jgi:thymidine kinase